MRLPYTHDELRAMQQRLKESMAKTEHEHPEVRPLPPMTTEESFELLTTWFDVAVTRVLTVAESILMGQLLACYRMGIEAELLGRKGRYFVISEADMARLAGSGERT